MNLRLLCSVILAGLFVLPAAAANRKPAPTPLQKTPVARPVPVPAPAVKKPAPVKAVKPAPAPKAPAKPVIAVRKKTLSLKPLFSRKAAPAPVPVPKPVAVIPKKCPVVKVKKAPVIRRDPGEFIDISYPMLKKKKASIATAAAIRR